MKVKIPNSLNSRNFLNYFFPTQIEWFHNGTTMFTGSRYRMEHAYGFVSLTILNLCPEDSGEYKIKATNNLGSCTSTWNINFSSRPKQIKASHQQSSTKLTYDPTLRGSASCCVKTFPPAAFPPPICQLAPLGSHHWSTKRASSSYSTDDSFSAVE